MSKFGLGRFFDGFVDLLTILMITRYRTRPSHLFGALASVAGVIGFGLLAYLTVLWFLGEAIGNRPLMTLGVLLMIGAIQFVGLGLVAELLVRTTIKPSEIFSIAATRGLDPVVAREVDRTPATRDGDAPDEAPPPPPVAKPVPKIPPPPAPSTAR